MTTLVLFLFFMLVVIMIMLIGAAMREGGKQHPTAKARESFQQLRTTLQQRANQAPSGWRRGTEPTPQPPWQPPVWQQPPPQGPPPPPPQPGAWFPPARQQTAPAPTPQQPPSPTKRPVEQDDAASSSSLDTTLSTSSGAPDHDVDADPVLAGPRVVPLPADVERQVREYMQQGYEVMAVRLVCDETRAGILDAQKTVRTLMGLPSPY